MSTCDVYKFLSDLKTAYLKTILQLTCQVLPKYFVKTLAASFSESLTMNLKCCCFYREVFQSYTIFIRGFHSITYDISPELRGDNYKISIFQAMENCLFLMFHYSTMIINISLCILVLQEKKVDLKERLIADWEDKKRQVENDKIHMELSMGECTANTYERSFINRICNLLHEVPLE